MMDLFWLLGGLALLLLGGEGLVRGASGVGVLARLSPAVIGLTIVAAGTSMPELVVSVQAALAGSHSVALGNVVGSNIFNIGFVLGATALLGPLRIQSLSVRMEWPVVVFSSGLLLWMAQDQHIERVEGGVLLLILLLFCVWAVRLGQKNSMDAEPMDLGTASFGRTGKGAWASNLTVLAMGAGLLALGAEWLVHGAVGLATRWGVSEAVIGLTIVAGGTSTPELVTSLVAAKKGKADMAVTNVLGSNIFNVLAILGTTSLVRPAWVPPEFLTRDIWWMLGFSLALFPLMRTGMRITRWEGGLLLSGYAAYLGILLYRAS